MGTFKEVQWPAHSHMVNWGLPYPVKEAGCSVRTTFPLTALNNKNYTDYRFNKKFLGRGGIILFMWDCVFGLWKRKMCSCVVFSWDSHFIKTLISKVSSQVKIAFGKQQQQKVILSHSAESTHSPWATVLVEVGRGRWEPALRCSSLSSNMQLEASAGKYSETLQWDRPKSNIVY